MDFDKSKSFNNSKIIPTITLWSQEKKFKIPANQGVLTSNAWRFSVGSKIGNTIQWDYQVSAVYKGNKKVESISTSWYASASLKISATTDLGMSKSSVQASSASSWQNKSTKTKSWTNTNGSKSADYKSNIVISPSSDYRSNTISLINTAKVKLKGDPKPYSISSGI